MSELVFKGFFCFFLLGVFTWGLFACNAKKDQTHIKIVQDMMDQISIKSQDWDPKQKELSPLRIPPEGTVPRGHTPYPFKGQPLKASRGFKNPFPKASAEMMSLGRKHYENFCALCHGSDGSGKGRIAPFMSLRPPSLLSERAKSFTDGEIFHIISEGKGVMGSHRAQIPQSEDIWAVVNYIRSLQRISQDVKNKSQ